MLFLSELGFLGTEISNETFCVWHKFEWQLQYIISRGPLMEDKETFPLSSTDQSSFHTKWATYSSYSWALDSQTIERTNNQRNRASEEVFWKLCKTHWKGQLPSNYFSSKPYMIPDFTILPRVLKYIWYQSKVWKHLFFVIMFSGLLHFNYYYCDYYAQINTNNFILINNPWAQFTFVTKNNLKHWSCNNFRSNIKITRC